MDCIVNVFILKSFVIFLYFYVVVLRFLEWNFQADLNAYDSGDTQQKVILKIKCILGYIETVYGK